MGYNTTVVVLNDALDQIRDDPDFGRKLYEAILKVQRGKPVDVSAGYHVNAATVIETHHADQTAFVAVGGNYGVVLETKFGDPLDFVQGFAYADLSDKHQKQAAAMFLNAGDGDGYIYRVSSNRVLSRRKA